ncbi:MAG: Ran GTPase-activating protein (RanGAP) involved in mRNA processing and transport [Bradymonadia bacterium]|jgi:Ran GTPase-activating protein (RanGAP) involved in mRNA processing and transport
MMRRLGPVYVALIMIACSVDAKKMPKTDQATEAMSFRTSKLTIEGLEALIAGGALSKSNSLDLQDNPVGDAGAALLARSPDVGGLAALWLGETGLTDVGLAALAASPKLRPKYLFLGNNTFGAQGVQALVDGPVFTSVRLLRLTYSPIGDGGAQALANSAAVGQLEQLELTGCGLTTAGVKALLTSKMLTQLKELHLGLNGFESNALLALTEASHLPALKSLDLSGQRLDPSVKAALSAARPSMQLTGL